MTTRALGEKFGVRHITVQRWLAAADIRPRPSGVGLANRGIEAPTAADLQRLVHVEHLSYRQIAKIYGVDFTAVPHWLKAHGIERPTVWGTRRKGVEIDRPSAAVLRSKIEAGQSLRSISADLGVSHGTVAEWCRSEGIPTAADGWRGGWRLPCTDGHVARSVYEQRVDDWLHRHGIEHYVEPAYPFDQRYRADFRVGVTYIEVWGVTNNQSYLDRKAMKIERCAAEGLPLIGIEHWQFAQGRKWWRKLERLHNDL